MAKTPTKTESAEFDAPHLVSPDDLTLDFKNPRLVLSVGSRFSEDTIIDRLHREGELSELLQSISANGYLDFEPLVILRDGNKGPYTVIEGNRRLAALKLLRDPHLAAELHIQTPEVADDKRASLDRVRAIRVRSRADARTFIAFKHINGPHRWDSYAKAKYAAGWYQEEKQNNPNASLSDIAVRIGDRHDTIKRMVGGIYVLQQAEDADIFRIDDRATKRFAFSHLYTALSRAEYMEYLGLKNGWSRRDPEPNPIPEHRLDRLREVLHWIYGFMPDDVRPVVRSQNPDLRKLGQVLTSKAAVAVLRTEGSLNRAFEQTTPPEEKLSSALVSAQTFVREAVSSLQAYDDRDRSLLTVAGEIKQSAEIIQDHMKKKFDDAQAKAS